MRSAARRWLPTAAMLLLSLLSYVDRTTLALLAPTVLRETGLDAEQYGWIISAFSAAYLVGNPLWGLFLDRYGLRAGLALAVTLWTVASASHALAATALSFALARAALGFGEGATFPGGLRTAAQSLEPARRARGTALAYSGGSLGTILTPLLVTPIALRWGWRGAFVCTGVFGACWLALWAWVSRDPRLAPGAGPDPTTSTTPTRTAPPRPPLRQMLGFVAAYAFGGLPLGFVVYGAPIHLAYLGCDQTTLGRILWIPPLGWEIGYFFWGWIIDRAASRHALGPALFRRTFALLAVLAIPFAATPATRALPAVLALMFLAMFVSAGFVIVSLSEVTRRHAAAHAAFLAGLGAGGWSGGMTLAMPVFGRLFRTHGYGTAYAISAAAPVIGWLVWRALASGEEPALRSEA
jgi:ACS family hexuronate transporter-like MFS transporter